MVKSRAGGDKSTNTNSTKISTNTSTNQTKSMARASAQIIRGQRSNTVIDEKKVSENQIMLGMDEMDAMFEAAGSPEPMDEKKPADPADGDGDDYNGSSSKKKAKVTKRRSRRRLPRTPKATVRMSLPGANNEDEDDDEDEDEDEGSASVNSESKKYTSKLKSSKALQQALSPSELSKVSTAPPSPGDKGQELELELELSDHHEEEEEEEVELEEVFVPLAPATQETEEQESPAMMASPEADFPVDNDPNDDDDNVQEEEEEEEADLAGDDLGPPALPDDDFDDDHEDIEPAVDYTQQQQEEEEVVEAEEETQEDDAKLPAATADKQLSDTESDDDAKDGPGINMVHDPETPKIVRERQAAKEKAEHEKKKKVKAKAKRKSIDTEDDDKDDDNDDDDDDEVTPPRKTFKKKKKRGVVFSPTGVPIANRDYEEIPLADLVEESPEDKNVRRSTRGRCKPLQYWRNEKFGYGAHDERGELGDALGDMPVVKNVVKALPTPYRKRKETTVARKGTKGGKKGKRAGATHATVEEEVTPFDCRKLRRKRKILDGETAHIWDDGNDDSADLKVVSYVSQMEASDLPISTSRDKTEPKVVGKAAQAFNVPNDNNDNYVGYIMGNLLLPPKAIKDAESVGPCSQTFTLCTGQPRALEVAFGDPDLPEGALDPESAQRFLLGPGDMFRVPPGNCYRLQNHSTTTDCLLTWTIIRPRHLANTAK